MPSTTKVINPADNSSEKTSFVPSDDSNINSGDERKLLDGVREDEFNDNQCF